MIGVNQKTRRKKYDLDKLVQSSFGYSDAQLLEQFETAQATITESQIPPESEENVKRLEAEIKRLGIRPHFEHDKNKIGECVRQRDCLRPAFKVAMVFAVFGSLLIMSGIAAGTRKGDSLKADNKSLKICGQIKYEDGEDIANKKEYGQELQTIIWQ